MRVSSVLAFLGLLGAGCNSQAQNFVQLGAPFGDHMVLQHDVPITLWGTGCPGGDTLKVSIAGQTAWTHSDWQGRWELHLQPMKSGGPYQMLIEIGGTGPLTPSSAANARGGAELNDVMVGEVVLASPLTNSGKVPAASPHPYAFVRVLSAGAENSAAKWTFVSQDSVPARSASLFRLGADIAARLQMPVGVIETWNGPLCSNPDGCAVGRTSQLSKERTSDEDGQTLWPISRIAVNLLWRH
jgi:sialate O-acetylesterase